MANGCLLSLLDPSEDDLQPTAAELSKVSVPVLYRSRAGAALAGLPRPGDELYAGGCQLWPGFGTVSDLWKGKREEIQEVVESWRDSNRLLCPVPGLPVEVAEPRLKRPQYDVEAGPSLVQVHRVHGHLRHVQTV